MRQVICIKFPAPLSSTVIMTREQPEFITPRVLTNIRINGRNRKYVGTFENLKQLLRSLQQCIS